jgi:hypothetical protein
MVFLLTELILVTSIMYSYSQTLILYWMIAIYVGYCKAIVLGL